MFGEKDADGFYWGEAGSRSGFVPCNMVSEVQVVTLYSTVECWQQQAWEQCCITAGLGCQYHCRCCYYVQTVRMFQICIEDLI